MRFSAALGLTLPLVLSLSALTPVLGERTAQQIVLDAGKLLTEGSYVEAARAYGEAIGMFRLMLALYPLFAPLTSSPPFTSTMMF
jgi:hypothetical protein